MPHLERTDRVNWSTLRAMRTSPKHYIHGLATPREDTEALQLGRVTHCAVYEPDQLDARYVVSPRFNRAMNDDTAIAKGYDGGKQAAAAWSPGNREPIEADLWARAVAMRDALTADPLARSLVVGGYAERRIEWTDAETGIECRGRLDHVNGCLSDLKTTRSIAFAERDAARLGYHAQIAWYADGLAAAGIDTAGPPHILFVENVPPYDRLAVWLDDADLAAGRRIYRDCLRRLADCRRTGQWPGFGGDTTRRIALPAWALADDAEITLDGVPLL